MVRKLLLTLVALACSSCTSVQPISNPSGTILQAILPSEQYTILGTSSGETCGRFLLGYPLAGVTGEKNTYQSAVRKAIQAKNGDHFIQTTADFTFVGFPLPQFAIYQEVCVVVEGLVIKFK